MANMNKFALGAFAAAMLALSGAALAEDAFTGTWQVKDTKGTPFEITLAADGTASANRAGEGMKGTWTDGWTTKIAKEGDGYKKTAYEGDTSGAPTNTSDAVKK